MSGATSNRFEARTIITRRRFLAVSSAVALGSLLAACGGGSSATDTPKPAGASGTAAPAGGTTGTAAPAASTGKPIKGTELTVLWMQGSIQAATDLQEKNMD